MVTAYLLSGVGSRALPLGLAVSGVLALGVLVSQGPPAWTADGDDAAIVFADFAVAGAEDTDLFVIQPNGSGRTQLTFTPGVHESQPCWSPDRGSIAYSTRLARHPLMGEIWGLEVLHVRTGLTHTLSVGPMDLSPSWSPDGGLIAFASVFGYGTPSQGSSISVVSVDGGPPWPLIELPSATSIVQSPAWSPDGRQIVFSVSSDSLGGELFVMDADGTAARRILSHPGWDDVDPAWSPDGRFVAFASGFHSTVSRSARHDLWLLDLATGSRGAIVTHAADDLRRPSWSPDGSRLVFDALAQGASARHWELRTVRWRVASSVVAIGPGSDAHWGGSGAPQATTETPPATETGSTPTPPPTATSGSRPTSAAAATDTPPGPPTAPPLPTLRPFPTWPALEPTHTLGPPPTFPAPTETPAPPASRTSTMSVASPVPTAGLVFLPCVSTGRDFLRRDP